MSNSPNLKAEGEILEKLELVKNTVREVSKQIISEHHCLGIVPGTFIVCGEDDYQYCSEACLNIAKCAKEIY